MYGTQVVSVGSTSGPVGVTVSLHRGDTLIQTTQTSTEGSYVFTPLSSGKYTVVASHPTWTLIKNKVQALSFFGSINITKADAFNYRKGAIYTLVVLPPYLLLSTLTL